MYDGDELLAVRAAELYYRQSRTQDEVGTLLGVSRWKAGRLIAEARRRGFVRIEIRHPSARRSALEHDLCARFGLDDAVVVPTASGSDDLLRQVAAAASDYLAGLAPVPRILGVSWGRTLAAVAAQLPTGWAHDVEVVQINGSLSRSPQAALATETVTTIARSAGGAATLLPSPAILERMETRRALQHDGTVARVLELAASADTFLFSAGPATAASVHVGSGYLSAAQVTTLAAHGAVGDVLGRFVDERGEIVDADLDDRTLGLPLASLRAAERSIAVLSGADKHAVARAILAGGLCTVMITDERCAAAALDRHTTTTDEKKEVPA